MDVLACLGGIAVIGGIAILGAVIAMAVRWYYGKDPI